LGRPAADGAAVGDAVLRRLHHRGPDFAGIRSWDDAALLHTRLKIIDLSAAGDQPLTNEDRSIWAIYNGEIYNHAGLRRSLEARGHVFRGRSDGEVLPHLYEEKGPACVEDLRGMFALAIFDPKAHRMVLARDRFGIKPLFYALTSTCAGFASEIGALREFPGLDLSPDLQAVSDFAALFFVPAPQTFYRGIRSLEPGEMAIADLDGDRVRWRTEPYHRWTIAPNPGLSLEAATTGAEERLDAAVRSQLESDVPLGSLLSGGIDSSLISATAQKHLPGRLRTFNVRFAERGYDETPAALAVARQIRSEHLTLDVATEGGSWDEITGLLRHVGQPYADSSLFAVNGICRRMREHVTVALSGDGGDEVFGGYNYFWQLGLIDRWKRWPGTLRQAAMAALPALARLGVVRSTLPQRARAVESADEVGIIQALCSWLRPEEHGELLVGHGVLPVRRLFERQWDYRAPARASSLESLSALATEVAFRVTLANDYLPKVDIASMRESLEVRVPMLDETLVDFGLTLPHALKVEGRSGKRVLRGIARRTLPPEVWNRSKQGFVVPLRTWLDLPFKSALRETVLSRSSGLSSVFRSEVFTPWVEAFCGDRSLAEVSRSGLEQRMVMLLSLSLALMPGGRAA
jgi:asparagine synthase (glutamine-hydrolysing)